MSKIKIELPNYLTIEQYTKIGEMDGMSEIEKIVNVLSAVTDYSIEDVKKWNLNDVRGLYEVIATELFNDDFVLLPVFEFQNILWGLQPLSKMTLGEYIDLETALKKNQTEKVMSIMYRPITKNRLDSLEFKVKFNLKYAVGKVENLFDYYEIEEYNWKDCLGREPILKKLPMSVALGAYNFFLTTGMQLQIDMMLSSAEITETELMKMMNETGQAFQNTLDGSTFSQN